MKVLHTVITPNEIRSFYKEKCNDSGIKFSESKFRAFVDCCERDFYQWLEDNFKFFVTEELEKLSSTQETWCQ